MENQDLSLPRAVMFRDSFTTKLVPLLSEHFARIVYIREHAMKADMILKEKPDLVIEQILERLIGNPIKNEEALGKPTLERHFHSLAFVMEDRNFNTLMRCSASLSLGQK